MTRESETYQVEPRVMRVLLCLAARPGHPVTRDELLNAAWTEGFANDEGLTQAVCKLRKAFADRATQATVIETIPKVGYRLIAPVSAQPIAPNGHGPVSSNGQADEQKDHRHAPPRAPLSPATFGFGYRAAEWRWLAVCFALLIVFCALWISSFARPPAPVEHQRVFIHRLDSDLTSPKMKIIVRKFHVPFDVHKVPLEWNQHDP